MKRHGAFLIAWLAIVSCPAAGADMQWKPIGPWSASVEGLALDPKDARHVWAATDDGLYESRDGGGSWTAKGAEIGAARCVTLDVKTPSTLYVCAQRGGVFKSMDGGATFQAFQATSGAAVYGYGRSPLYHLAVDPVNPRDLIFTGSGMYRSRNGGATFADIDTPGIGSNDIRHIAFDPRDPKVVYASGGWLLRTRDGGATWAVVDFGAGKASAHVTAIHPTSRAVLVGSGGHGLYASSDGRSFERVGDGLYEQASIFDIAWSPKDPRRVYVAATSGVGDATSSVFRSDDGGRSFVDVGRELPYEKITALAIDAADPQVLDAGTEFSGVFATTDGGATWSDKVAGFASNLRPVTALAVVAPDDLYVATYGAVQHTSDGGRSWQRLRAGLGKGVKYEFLGAGGAPHPAVLVGSDNSLVVSQDGGETWEKRHDVTRCLAHDPRDARAFYLCLKEGGLTYAGTPPWRPAGDNTYFHAVAVDPSNPQNMYGADIYSLQRSTNGGRKWKKWDRFEKVKGAVVRRMEDRKVLAIEFDPANPRTLYVATEQDGVFASADGGETWTQAGLVGEDLTAFALDTAQPRRLAVGTRSKGVLVSLDGGGSWSDGSTGLPDDSRKKKEEIHALAFGPGSPAPLYAATDRGVYRAQ